VAGVSSSDLPDSTSSSFPWKLALTLYGLSFLPNLLSMNALFWDDWTWFNHQTGKLLKANYTGSGNAPWRTWIEVYLFQSSLPIFRIVTIIGYFAVGYFLFHILKRSKFFNAHQLVGITLLFLVIPVNSARISIANTKYGVDLFFFFLAWYLYETKSHKLAKVFAFVFFFLSYSTLPFPTFTLLPILYHVMLKSPKNTREYMREFANTIPLMLLPICYLALRQIYWPPMGGLVDMYTPQVSGIARSLIFVLICSIPLALLLASAKFRGIVKPNLLVAAGCFSVAIAAVPYMVGGRLVDISDWLIAFVPNFSDWDSRNQLTIPLGIALIIVGSMKLDHVQKPRWNSYPVLTTVLAVFVALNITFAQEYFLDGRKQEAVIEAMASNPELKSVRRILIDDQAVRFNARGRILRSYEWEGMLNKALGGGEFKVSYFQYPDCNTFQPAAVLHINSPNGRMESTLRGRVVIDLWVEKIDFCSN
jgi:hypothetical protein